MPPFSQDSPTTGQTGETEILRLIQERLGGASPPAPEGIGDDCATWNPPTDETTLLTADPVIFGQHFDASHAPDLVGAKLLKRNLSDIAAMGGRPGPALLALAMGPDLHLEWLAEFIGGLAAACTTYDVPLAGGDISSAAPGIFIATLTQTGLARRPITRQGAMPGSPILVTGTLGASLTGKHLHFKPRLAEGQWLQNQEPVLSMTDISDGLAKDLPSLLPEGTQAHIDLADLPVDPAADTVQQALCDGEDYELLFTLKPNADLRKWPFDTPLQQIGTVRKGEPGGIIINKATGVPVETENGYEHFTTAY